MDIETAVGLARYCLPDPGTRAVQSSAYLGKAPDAVKGPARQADRLVRPRPSRDSVGTAHPQGNRLADAKIGFLPSSPLQIMDLTADNQRQKYCSMKTAQKRYE